MDTRVPTPPMVGVHDPAVFQACLSLPGVAALGAVISASLGVDPVATAAALAAYTWIVQEPFVEVQHSRDGPGSSDATASPSPSFMRSRDSCKDHPADVFHMALLGPSGMGMERLLTFLDAAFGSCVSYRSAAAVPAHEGAPLPSWPAVTYAVGSPMVSHQRILRPSVTRTVRHFVPEEWLRDSSAQAASASGDQSFAKMVVLYPP